jgi:hypothetical protein
MIFTLPHKVNDGKRKVFWFGGKLWIQPAKFLIFIFSFLIQTSRVEFNGTLPAQN